MRFRQALRDLVHIAGINIYQASMMVRQMPRYTRDWRAYQRARTPADMPLALANAFPIFVDFAASAGTASGHYFFQDLWAARLIAARRPQAHVDVGSRIDGFVAHLLAFMPVTEIDIRPLPDSGVPGLTFTQGDLTNLQMPTSSIDSLSSLHAVEHVGLGRYGDPIEPAGWRKAIAELSRVVKPGGRLYFSVPIGRERVRFNADRVFAVSTILGALPPDIALVSFSLVDDAGRLHENVPTAVAETLDMGCALFEFTKISA